MSENAIYDGECADTGTTARGAPQPADMPRPTGRPKDDQPEGRRSRLMTPLRWLGRKLTQLVLWVARRVAAPLLVRRFASRLPAPLRRLGSLLGPGRERGFGFWWLVATVAIALALGLVVALLLSPVAALIALLVVAIWALVRLRRRTRDDCDNHRSRAPPRGIEPSVM